MEGGESYLQGDGGELSGLPRTAKSCDQNGETRGNGRRMRRSALGNEREVTKVGVREEKSTARRLCSRKSKSSESRLVAIEFEN